ncbi:hypothetical protein BDR06DRAFT_974845 [Suillus hirtellus]|nr:hypothetical protein BDR06DRAFT_974845 [Suillus hirtellus]
MTWSKGSEVPSKYLASQNISYDNQMRMHQQSQTDKDRTWYGGLEKLEKASEWMDDLWTTWTSTWNFWKIGTRTWDGWTESKSAKAIGMHMKGTSACETHE